MSEAATGRPSPPSLDESLEPLARTKRLSDRVADVLLKRIAEADLRPGDRLPSERQLAERLRVARTVVREAVRELAARGIVEVRPGTGVVVAEANATAASESLSLFVRGSREVNFDGVQEVRSALEVEMADLAARRADDAGIERLRAALGRQHTTRGDLEESASADLEFHRVLAQLTRNPLFLIILDALRDMLLEVRRRAMQLPGNTDIGLEAHARILEAVEARDPRRARREMSRHFDVSYREFFGGGLSPSSVEPVSGEDDQ